MAIATAGTLIRRQLVQVSELDPMWRFIGSTDSTGDGSGGLNVLTWTVPPDLSVMIMSMAAEIGQSSTANVGYVINEGAAVAFESGALAVAIDTINQPEVFSPPKIMVFEHPITIVMRSANTNLEVMTGRLSFLAWELQIGRNLPQKFFWPATMD